jgi:acetate kinase
MNGIDAVVFTAGIGENSPEIRARICASSSWLGLRVDDAANHAGGPRISAPGAPVSAWVIPTDEERMIAEHTLATWRARRSPTPVAAG